MSSPRRSLFRRVKVPVEPTIPSGVTPEPEPVPRPVSPVAAGDSPNAEPEPEPVPDRPDPSKPMPREPENGDEPAPDDPEDDEEDRENALVARERALRENEEKVVTAKAKLDALISELEARAKDVAPKPAESPRPQEPVAPALPRLSETVPSAPVRPKAPEDARWKHIPQEERITIDPNSQMALDIEALFQQGFLPSEVIERVGLPSNRFTHDQIRRFYLRVRNTGAAPAQAKPGALGSLDDEIERIEKLRKIGLVFSRDDLDRAIDKALERAGNQGGGGPDELQGLDGESRANVLMAREVRALGQEVIDTARAITGHPKIGQSIAQELRDTKEKRGGRTELPTRHVPELPPGGVRTQEPIAPTPQPQAQERPALPVSIESEHPEFWPALDQIVDLSPRIYEFIDQRKHGLSANQVLENVQRDASLAAIASWRLSSKTKPVHEWDNTGTCVRCGKKKGPDTVGRSCEKGFSQRDLLRRLHGLQVKDLIELVARYQQSVEVTSPLDALGGMSVRQFLMEKPWGPDDRINLGGNTIYSTVLRTDEGVMWLGTFLGKLTEEIDRPERELMREPAQKEEPTQRAKQADTPQQTPEGGIVVTRTVDMPAPQETTQ